MVTLNGFTAYQVSGAAGGVLDAVNTTQTVSDTTTETTIATLSVPAGSATADARFVVDATGSLLNNGGTYTHTYRLKIDGTTVMTMAKSQPNSGNLLAWRQQWVIDCQSDSIQNIGYEGIWASATTSSGVAKVTTTGGTATGFSESTVDMSGAHDITITVELEAAAASVYDNIYAASLVQISPFG